MTPLPDSLLESVAAAAVREGLADAVFTRLKSPIGKLLATPVRKLGGDNRVHVRADLRIPQHLYRVAGCPPVG